jgi:hypothetical protein
MADWMTVMTPMDANATVAVDSVIFEAAAASSDGS